MCSSGYRTEVGCWEGRKRESGCSCWDFGVGYCSNCCSNRSGYLRAFDYTLFNSIIRFIYLTIYKGIIALHFRASSNSHFPLTMYKKSINDTSY